MSPDPNTADLAEQFRPSHLPTPEFVASLPMPSRAEPLRVLVSACLAGFQVGFDGSAYGEHIEIQAFLAHPHVRAIPFCPEGLAFGTPRALCDIHGGDGHDVLAGRARVLADDGQDWTKSMITAAYAMLDHARSSDVRIALLMDISAACGSQVIYNGTRPDAPYQVGHGVCAALLVQSGIPVLSNRDLRTLDLLWIKLGTCREVLGPRFDHHESDWYREYFPFPRAVK